ncbi:MAG: hypothetical protein DRI61_11310 [Chloroflexi bacterium]|nr:MAG: hypothetical protein DRI61_11310 [Chloroflexota bacterium]
MKNRDVYTELDCPYRQNILSDDMTCNISFGCDKGFDPGQLERGDLLCDIVCWLDEELDDENAQNDEKEGD